MTTWALLIVGAMLFVAYANGANDNFKGVATLFGSGAASYRNALGWATVTTFAGSLAAALVASRLVSVFQGQGLVPADVARSEPFVAAVVLGAALTVMLATKLGMPISTTHGLTGALLGGGLSAVGPELGFRALAVNFFAPLLVTPMCAGAIASIGFPLLSRFMRRTGLNDDSCLCVNAETTVALATETVGAFTETAPGLRVIVDRQAVCAQPGARTIFGIGGKTLLDGAHFLSAGAVGFARGLNDTPKIVALGLAAGALDLQISILSIAAIMALGGLVSSRPVAATVSKKITDMDPQQGLWANLVTSFLVVFASKWGLPVSTTHVSCGALFGIGIANGQACWNMIRLILAAWVLTLPTAAVFTAAVYFLLRQP